MILGLALVATAGVILAMIALTQRSWRGVCAGIATVLAAAAMTRAAGVWEAEGERRALLVISDTQANDAEAIYRLILECGLRGRCSVLRFGMESAAEPLLDNVSWCHVSGVGHGASSFQEVVSRAPHVAARLDSVLAAAHRVLTEYAVEDWLVGRQQSVVLLQADDWQWAGFEGGTVDEAIVRAVTECSWDLLAVDARAADHLATLAIEPSRTPLRAGPLDSQPQGTWIEMSGLSATQAAWVADQLSKSEGEPWLTLRLNGGRSGGGVYFQGAEATYRPYYPGAGRGEAGRIRFWLPLEAPELSHVYLKPGHHLLVVQARLGDGAAVFEGAGYLAVGAGRRKIVVPTADADSELEAPTWGDHWVAPDGFWELAFEGSRLFGTARETPKSRVQKLLKSAIDSQKGWISSPDDGWTVETFDDAWDAGWDGREGGSLVLCEPSLEWWKRNGASLKSRVESGLNLTVVGPPPETEATRWLPAASLDDDSAAVVVNRQPRLFLSPDNSSYARRGQGALSLAATADFDKMRFTRMQWTALKDVIGGALLADEPTGPSAMVELSEADPQVLRRGNEHWAVWAPTERSYGDDQFLRERVLGSTGHFLASCPQALQIKTHHWCTRTVFWSPRIDGPEVSVQLAAASPATANDLEWRGVRVVSPLYSGENDMLGSAVRSAAGLSPVPSNHWGRLQPKVADVVEPNSPSQPARMRLEGDSQRIVDDLKLGLDRAMDQALEATRPQRAAGTRVFHVGAWHTRHAVVPSVHRLLKVQSADDAGDANVVSSLSSASQQLPMAVAKLVGRGRVTCLAYSPFERSMWAGDLACYGSVTVNPPSSNGSWLGTLAKENLPVGQGFQYLRDVASLQDASAVAASRSKVVEVRLASRGGAPSLWVDVESTLLTATSALTVNSGGTDQETRCPMGIRSMDGVRGTVELEMTASLPQTGDAFVDGEAICYVGMRGGRGAGVVQPGVGAICAMTSGGVIGVEHRKGALAWRAVGEPLALPAALALLVALFLLRPWTAWKQYWRSKRAKRSPAAREERVRQLAEDLEVRLGELESRSVARRLAGLPAGIRGYQSGDSMSVAVPATVIATTELGQRLGLPPKLPQVRLKQLPEAFCVDIVLKASLSLGLPVLHKQEQKCDTATVVVHGLASWLRSGGGDVRVCVEDAQGQVTECDASANPSVDEVERAVNASRLAKGGKIAFVPRESAVVLVVADAEFRVGASLCEYARQLRARETQVRMCLVTDGTEHEPKGLSAVGGSSLIVDRVYVTQTTARGLHRDLLDVVLRVLWSLEVPVAVVSTHMTTEDLVSELVTARVVGATV